VPVLAIWSRTDNGRALMVVCRHRYECNYDIAFARELDSVERSQLEKWEEARDSEEE
jgi:hypothetical protein